MQASQAVRRRGWGTLGKGGAWVGRAFALAGWLGLAACQGPTSSTYTNASGSLALSQDDALLYAVDTDNDLLAVVDTHTEQVVARVKVGAAPERVVVGPDDTVYVSNRGERTVSVIRKNQWSADPVKVEVGVEPVGLAVSPDNRTLYVVNSTSPDDAEFGTLTAIDLGTLQPKWDLPVGAEPRGIALLEHERAVITLYKSGDVVEVDLRGPRVVQSETPLYQQVNQSKQSGSSSGRAISTFHARAMAEVVASPDGKRVYAPTLWAREDPIAVAPGVAGGYYASGGPCNIGAIATPGLVTFSATDGLVPLVDDLTSCSTRTNSASSDFPPTTLGTPNGTPIQGPVAVAVDPTGAWLFVVNRETNNVAVLPAERREGDDLTFSRTGTTVRALVDVGRSPTGIALSRDGSRAYVYSAFDHRIDTLGLEGHGPQATVRVQGLPMVVANDSPKLSPNELAGRKLFFDARDPQMTNVSTGVSCATCHLEGRDDSHVWSFPDGPRQTPSLAGRHTLETAPYHWSGQFPTLKAFLDHTVKQRMGGSGLRDDMVSSLKSFINSLPAPENPHHRLGQAPTEAQQRGALVFQKAQCSHCHGGENLDTDVDGVTEVDVGTLTARDTITKVNIPSLLTLARTAPYLHSGQAASLKARLLQSKDTDRHGHTSSLTESELDDLVAYLKSL